MRPKLTAKILYTYVMASRETFCVRLFLRISLFPSTYSREKSRRDSRKNKTAPTRKETKPLAPRVTVQRVKEC